MGNFKYEIWKTINSLTNFILFLPLSFLKLEQDSQEDQVLAAWDKDLTTTTRYIIKKKHIYEGYRLFIK